MAPVRVSILGTGLSLQAFHFPLIDALPDKFVLHSVMERTDRGKAREVCGPSTNVVNTIEQVVNDPEVDLVSDLQLHLQCYDTVLTTGRHLHPQQYSLPLRQSCFGGRKEW